MDATGAEVLLWNSGEQIYPGQLVVHFIATLVSVPLSCGEQLGPAPGPVNDHNSEAYVPSGEQVDPAPPLSIDDI